VSENRLEMERNLCAADLDNIYNFWAILYQPGGWMTCY
jgi:hypothetical protein